MHADLVEIAPPPEALHLLGLDHDNRYAFGTGVHICLGNNKHDIGVLAVCDECLLAIDDVITALAPRSSAHRLQIRSRARLSHCDSADQFSRCHFGKPFELLRFGAISEQIMRNDIRMDAVARAEATTKTEPADFFRDHNIVSARAAAAAIVFRDAGAQEARLPRFQPRGTINHACGFPFFAVRQHLALKKPARLIANDCQFLIHPR